MIIIDAKNTILGRLASFTARKLIESESVIIVNAQEAVITGGKTNILARYKQKVNVGDLKKGPFFTRTADGLVRRTVRGMLPIKTKRGRDAFKKLKVYASSPDSLDEKVERLEKFDVNKTKDKKYVTIKEICSWLKHRHNEVTE